jgi:hypothetical protein
MDLKKISEEIREIISEKQKEFQLTFEEDAHKYTMLDINGKLRDDFPSVSKLMKYFYTEFDSEGISFRKANGDPYEQQRLLEEWAAAGTYSTNMGSRVHFLLEKHTLEEFGIGKEVRQPIYECDAEQIVKGDTMVVAGKRYIDLLKERNCILLDTEMVLGHPELGYTGQPDKVWLIIGTNGDLGILITDWKTNKPKNFEKNKFTKPMKKPFEDLPDNALGHYNTQLPFYGKLLLKMLEGSKYGNIKLYGCVISHLKEDSLYDEYKVPQNIINIVMGMDVNQYLTK